MDVAINPRQVIAEELVRFGHDPRIRQIAMLDDDRFEILDLTVRAESELANMRFDDLPKTGSVIGAIIRDGNADLPARRRRPAGRRPGDRLRGVAPRLARRTRAVRLRTGIDIGAALDLVGGVLKWLAPAFLLPVVVAIGYGEPFWAFLVAGAITGIAGLALDQITGEKQGAAVTPRESFLVVALIWLLVPIFGALPFILDGGPQLSRPVDAYFETVSGFTATGATLVAKIEELERSMLFWRQLSHWLGGMGIIVLAVAILPRLRIGGRQLLQSELAGPTEIEQLGDTIRADRAPAVAALRRPDADRDPRARLPELDEPRPRADVLRRRRPGAVGRRARRLLHAHDLDRRVRADHAVPDPRLHGHRGDQLPAAVPLLRAAPLQRARARRGAAAVPRR